MRDSFSDRVIALSNGKWLGPIHKTNTADEKSAYAASDEKAEMKMKKAKAEASRVSEKKSLKPSQPVVKVASPTPLGDVVRVVDASFSTVPLGLLL